MMRLARRAVPAGVLLVLLGQSVALGATANVSMTNFVFTPSSIKVSIGDTVLWTNATSTTSHTSTSDTPLSLWDSGSVPPGGTFSRVFTAAGAFPYHCTFHVSLGMVGTVVVKMKASPSSGPAGTIFTIKAATVNASGPFVYDIQRRNPGGTFQDWMTGITSKKALFDSSGFPSGVYQFRSRIRNSSTGAASGFSPAKSITVT